MLTISFLRRSQLRCALTGLVRVVIAIGLCQVSAAADTTLPLAMNVQSQPASAGSNQAPAAGSNQAPAARKQAGLRLQGVRMSPLSRPRPGRLFTIRTGVDNQSNQEKAAMVLARVVQAPDLQAAVEVHVPPGESRTVDLHLRLPSNLAPGSDFDLNFSLNSLEDDRVMLSASGLPLIDSLHMKVDTESLVTVVMLESEPPQPPEWYWPHDNHMMSYECMIAARIDTGHQRQTLSINEESLPTQLVDWDGIDAFVIAHEGPLRDPVAMEAMGRWLAAGGQGWVMLDAVGEDDLGVLLPDGMMCETIDDIELNEFVVDADLVLPISETDRTIQSEEPLRLRRVVQSGGTVTHRIGGFPAAIWFSVGKGKLLVTTLEARGWVKPRAERRRDEPSLDSDYQMQDWSKPMVEQFYQPPDVRSPLDAAEITYPLKHIGSPVLNRNFVITIVFGFCGVLALAGWWCWHSGTLTRMGWLVPLISAGATVPLLVASNRMRSELPDTSAHLQVIEVQPGSRFIQGTQWTTTYMSGSSSANLVADGDAMISWPDSGQQNDLRRWLWEDFQHWQLSSSGWPHGLWRLNSRFGLAPRSLDVTARIDAQGLTVQVPAELGEPLQDAVLCYVPGDVAVCNQIGVDQTIRVPDDQVTLGQSWLGSTIVNDEQSRRDEVYRLLSSRTTEARYPSYPALIGWTKLWTTPTNWSEPRDERGAALVFLPVKLLPVATGQTVSVPHTIIKVESPLEGLSRSTAFGNHSGLWRDETTIAMEVPVRFHLPQQVCPIEASEIICDLQVRAPQRDVRITSSAGGKQTVVGEFRSPLAAERLRITDPAILSDARDGIIDFRIAISQPVGSSSSDFSAQLANWQVDYFRITVNGSVLER